jgi:hypothetical protein
MEVLSIEDATISKAIYLASFDISVAWYSEIHNTDFLLPTNS